MTTLSELIRLQQEATPGPWENCRGFVRTVAGNPQVQPPVLKAEGMEVRTSCLWVAECRDGEAFYNPDGNANFIAAARNFDLKALATQYEAMRETLRFLFDHFDIHGDGLGPYMFSGSPEHAEYRCSGCDAEGEAKWPGWEVKIEHKSGCKYLAYQALRASLDTKARGDE